MPDIETIVHGFGKIQEEVSKRIPTHYPTLKFPESLLPYKKEEIASAFEEVIKIKQNDPEIVNLLKASLAFLDGFIDDKKAYDSNHQLLGQNGYWEAIRRNKISWG